MTPWVKRLILANVAVFLLTYSAPGWEDAFVLLPALLLTRPWTAVSYMFLHAGLGHIFFNMLALFFFGPKVEARLGGQSFLKLYFLSGLTGALLSLVTPYAPIVGASGAIFGVQLAYARFWPDDKILLYGVIPVSARWMVVLMTGLSLYGGFSPGGSGIAHFTHLGGFLGGYLYLKWLEHFAGPNRFRTTAGTRPLARGEPSGPERWSRIRREQMHEVNRAELDRIVEQMQRQGVGSLTAGDREFLDRFSRG